MPKVSVVIPCYNAMRFLPETVDSVLKQTHQDFEIIIVNDGSSDNIEQWVNALKDERICLISQTNQGQSAARNVGITKACGEYIAFLDADDLWHPEKLAKQVGILETNADVGLVYSWVLLIDEENKPLKKLWTISAEGNVWKKLIEGNMIACGSVPMIRKACVDTVGLFGKFSFGCEDWDFWLRIAARYPFRVVKETLVYYRECSNSVSRASGTRLGKTLKNMEESYAQLIDSAFEVAPSYPPSYLKALKPRSHALACLNVAWRALKSAEGSFKYVSYYQRQAIAYDPQIALRPEYKKINRVAFLIRLLGLQNYERLRHLPRMYTW